ncbi:zinc-binding oxidoreductase [Fusarium albosuccineum]|uniref:Zinc-binding oxidoreductase n=1 Tax=Fusarium albosuccineum TaxID=1237068 RepID=A0A8H4LF32_9HYPO|nr:zinc-binding oxidoreductase [Fusarium albosuccineum]
MSQTASSDALLAEQIPSELRDDEVVTNYLPERQHEYAFQPLRSRPPSETYPSPSSPPPPSYSLKNESPENRDVPWTAQPFNIIRTWNLEVVALITSAAALVSLLILLVRQDGQPLSKWTMPLSLNTIVSLLSVMIKTPLAFVVGNCIAQGKWTWFSKRQGPLAAFVAIEEAGRGPLGSLQLMFKLKFRHWVSFGAAITIGLLAIDPLLQSVILYQGKISPATGSMATIARSSKLDIGEWYSHSAHAGVVTVNGERVSDNVNCFDLFPDIGCNKRDGIRTVLAVSFRPEETYSFQDWDTLLASFVVLHAQDEYWTNQILWEEASVQATECALRYCVQAYQPIMKSGKVTEGGISVSFKRVPSSWQLDPIFEGNEIDRKHRLLLNDLDAGFGNSLARLNESECWMLPRYDLQLQLVEKNTSLPEDVQSTFNITHKSIATMMESLDSKAVASINRALSNSSNITAAFDAAARLMSFRIREIDNNPVEGFANDWVIYVRVRWPLITAPVAICIAVIVFAGRVIIESRRVSLEALKSDPMQLLLHGFDSASRDQLRENRNRGQKVDEVERVGLGGERRAARPPADPPPHQTQGIVGLALSKPPSRWPQLMFMAPEADLHYKPLRGVWQAAAKLDSVFNAARNPGKSFSEAIQFQSFFVQDTRTLRLHSMATHTCKALVNRECAGKPSLVQELLPVPRPASNQALVRVSTAAQNPTDVLCFDDNIFGDGAVLGCDFTGTVEAVGSSVTRLEIGDTIAGLIWGGEIAGQGAFSEYTLADENICFKIPSIIPLEQAATVPLAATTAWLALFRSQSLNIDRTAGSGLQLLVWAGSTSVGLYAVQIAALFGFSVATVCSPRHFPLLHSHGAKHVFDYKDPDVIQKIRKALPEVKYIFDTIGNETSSATASEAMSKSGGVLCTVRPAKEFTESVTPQTKVTSVFFFTSFLKDLQLGTNLFPASEEDHQLASEFNQKLPELLARQMIRPNNPLAMHGFDRITEGFQAYRDGKISGYKESDLPYSDEDTTAQSVLLQRLAAVEAVLSEHSASIVALKQQSDRLPGSTSLPLTQRNTPISNQDSRFRSPSNLPPSRTDQQDDQNLPPLTIPPKHQTSASTLLLLPQVAHLIGDYPEGYFFRIENARQRTATAQHILDEPPGLPGSDSPIDKYLADRYIRSFFDIVQPFHPFLNSDELKSQCEDVISRGFDPSVRSALALAVLALGSIAWEGTGATRQTRQANNSPTNSPQSSSTNNGFESLGDIMIKRSLRILFPSWTVSFGGDIVVSQGLILCALYFTYRVDPLMAWRLVHMAATSIQQVFNHEDVPPNDPKAQTLTRLSWVCFILESDVLAEFNQPRSGIELLVDKLPFPDYGGPACPSHLYVLAEISARLLLNRIHHSLFFADNLTIYTGGNLNTPGQDHSCILHPDASLLRVCKELDRQLETWYESLPEAIKPELEGSPTGNQLASLLRLRYWSAKQVIYRAFVIHVTSLETQVLDQVPPLVLKMCRICLNASRFFILTSNGILSHRTPYTFSVTQMCLTSMLTLAIAAKSKILCEDLEDIDSLLNQTIETLEPWIAVNPGIKSAYHITQSVASRHMI